MRKEVQQHISKTDKTDTPNFQMPDNCRVGIEPHLVCESCRPCHHYTIGNNQNASALITVSTHMLGDSGYIPFGLSLRQAASLTACDEKSL